MVKPLDYNPELIDHIGWQLWRASDRWKSTFQKQMTSDQGYAWFGEARANVIPHLDRKGTRQADLVVRMQLSKQAVQQFVDGLVDDGVVERAPDPRDARGKIVKFTAAGLAALNAANRVKRKIEKEYADRLGNARFKDLCGALAELNASFGEGTEDDERQE